MRRLFVLAVLIVAAVGLQELVSTAPSILPSPAGGTALILGFLLLAAYVAGQAAKDLSLPRITGYILLGVLVGPDVLELVSAGDVSDLQMVDEIAISLIALSAGAELKVSELRERGSNMAGIMLTEMTAVFIVTAGGVVLLSSYLPLTQGMGTVATLTIAMIFGSIAIANSPAVAIALINENRSRGPVTSTVLGVTVMKDVVIILLFAVALAIARTILQGQGFQTGFILDLGWEIGGSLALGAISGWILALYLQRYRIHPVLFVLAAAFLNAQLAHYLHLEVLLLSLTAGFVVENASGVHGEEFLEWVEANSLPFYALFFSLAGAKIELASLGTVGLFVLLFVLMRGLAVFSGTWLGSRMVGAEPAVQKYAWTGFVSQAGVTVGMVVIASRAFPEWGPDLVTLFVAMVAVHELIGPVLFQWGLEASDEVGKRSQRDGDEDRSPSPAPAADAVSR